jgi:two-component system LytT family response regulator
MFFRASRRHLVNLRFVEGIEPDVSGTYTVRLRGGHTVQASRRHSRLLRETLGL